MQVVTGTVVGGKVILEGASLPEGTVVTILAKESEERYAYHLPFRRSLKKRSKKPTARKGFPQTNSSIGDGREAFLVRPLAAALTGSSFASGGLNRDSFARPGKLFTV